MQIRSPRNTAGLTLTELMVSATVIVIILTLVVAGLRGAHTQAQSLKAEINARESARLLTTLAASNRDELPLGKPTNRFATSNGVPAYIIEWPGQILGFDYFSHSALWPAMVLAAGHAPSGVWVSPSRSDINETPLSIQCDYWLSHAFLAGPEHWREVRDQSVHMWKSVRISDTAFPSHKSLVAENPLVADNRASGRVRIQAAGFVDGHAETVPGDAVASPMQNRFYHNMAIPLVTTRDGVLGLDTRSR